MMPGSRRPTGAPEHVALLGDSIFDNGAYTRGEPDVVSHLRRLLPEGWTATLCAVDGATTQTMRTQLARVPPGASALVVAVGGNDALQNSDLLSLRAGSPGKALAVFAERLVAFEGSYRQAVRDVSTLGRPVTVCTIYNGALDDAEARLARVGLMMFNDVIIRAAVELGLGVIELRLVCTDPEDYANPIEPSGRGGLKIAAAVARAVGARTAERPPSLVWR